MADREIALVKAQSTVPALAPVIVLGPHVSAMHKWMSLAEENRVGFARLMETQLLGGQLCTTFRKEYHVVNTASAEIDIEKAFLELYRFRERSFSKFYRQSELIPVEFSISVCHISTKRHV